MEDLLSKHKIALRKHTKQLILYAREHKHEIDLERTRFGAFLFIITNGLLFRMMLSTPSEKMKMILEEERMEFQMRKTNFNHPSQRAEGNLLSG